MGKISPMDLAKVLGCRPQQIYGLIRRNKIPLVERNPKMVDQDAATSVILSSRREGRNRKQSKKDLVVPGDILMYDTSRSEGNGKEEYTQTLIVEDISDTQVYVRSIDDRRRMMGTGSKLRKRIESNEIEIVHPTAFLVLIADAFELQYRPDLAESLRRWLEEHKEPLESFGGYDNGESNSSEAEDDEDKTKN